jgi:hypothetical protein
MAESFNVWPNNVPTSYSGEPFAWPQYQSLPGLYGIDLSNPFFVSFLFGAAFVAFFSVNQFNKRSQDPLDPVTAESQLLQELTPMDLRDPRLITQSYVLYVAVLLLVYTALTYYGSTILNWVNTVLPVAGYTTDLSQYDIAGPQWPLIVALGMIGVLPVLTPVEAVEIRLRRWTHRAVGIPLTIYRHAEAMRLQYRVIKGAKPGSGPIYDRDKVPTWLRQAVGDDRAIAEGFEAQWQLDELSGWIKDGRGEWPSGQSDRPIERLFDLQYLKARDALREFGELLDPKNATAGPAPEDVVDQAVIAAHQAHHITELRKRWDKAAQGVVDARDSLLALLGVGAEKQSDYTGIANEELRKLLKEAVRVDHFQKGPQVGIFLLLIPIFIVFATAISFNYHAPFTGATNTRTSVVVIAAVYEVLLICAVFLFPLMAAMNYRFWRKVAYRDSWARLHALDFEQGAMLQVLSAAALAFLVAVIGLTALAVAQAGIMSRGTSEFWRLLIEARLPLLPLALSLAGISVIFCLAVLFAVEERESLQAAVEEAKKQGRPAVDPNRHAIGLGVLCALTVLAYQVVLTYFWYVKVIPGPSCAGGRFFHELFYPDHWNEGTTWNSCARYYGLTSLVVYTLLAFLSVTFLIPRQRSRASQDGEEVSIQPPQPALGGGTAGVLLLTTLIIGLTAGHALGSPRGRMLAVDDRTVVVGFRADAPPFSYLRQFGEEERYVGYLVDLCNLIFAGDAAKQFTVVTTTVTAQDRFERLVREPRQHWDPSRTREPLADASVDLLCDPVTLRYTSEQDDGKFQRTDGIFSPIVFVTGVSYLERSGGQAGATQLGFVSRTTTERIVLQACERDGLRVRDADKPGVDISIVEECDADLKKAIRIARAAAESATPKIPLAESRAVRVSCTGGAKTRYQFCAFENHQDLVAWFCGEPIESKRYYFGDKDIIVGQLDAWLESGGLCEKVTRDYPFRSYEPYALLISKINPNLVQFVQRRVYEIFSDRDQVISLFTANFSGKAMSIPLANLFNLNGVEDKLYLSRRTLGHRAE